MNDRHLSLIYHLIAQTLMKFKLHLTLALLNRQRLVRMLIVNLSGGNMSSKQFF